MKPSIIPSNSIQKNIRPLNGSSYLWGAHHPHCERHSHHLFWIKGHPLCLGCTCVYSGIIMGILIAIAINWSLFSFIGWMLFHLALLIPTVIQPAMQKKPFKIVSRFLLGVCVSSYFLSGFFFFSPSLLNIWLFRVLVIIAFVIGFKLLFQFRNKLIDDPCKECPLGEYPTCDWNLPRLLDENEELQKLGMFFVLQNGQYPVGSKHDLT